jgi:hypothetical protein
MIRLRHRSLRTERTIIALKSSRSRTFPCLPEISAHLLTAIKTFPTDCHRIPESNFELTLLGAAGYSMFIG